ncbi:reverse transcriptase domain-containing protein, partial [Pseudoalteromonas sp.]|uniref:reverse transcriptase domain-containing protein n=1 Tax=Pseudoalteromonas sp. TaxID=53249 RepID=UPI0026268DEE
VLEPVDVYNILRKMPAKMSMGPDFIPSCVLMQCAISLALPLSILYNASLSSGIVPSAWKHAHVVPIFKKGEHAEPSNYRPVSLISGLGKGLEDPVHHEVLAHCTRQKLISNEQFVFLPGRSTTGQLIDCFDLITKALDDGCCVDVVYLDLSKAFDTISVRKLLLKLESLGISSQLLSWFRSYLS